MHLSLSSPDCNICFQEVYSMTTTCVFPSSPHPAIIYPNLGKHANSQGKNSRWFNIIAVQKTTEKLGCVCVIVPLKQIYSFKYGPDPAYSSHVRWVTGLSRVYESQPGSRADSSIFENDKLFTVLLFKLHPRTPKLEVSKTTSELGASERRKNQVLHMLLGPGAEIARYGSGI